MTATLFRTRLFRSYIMKIFAVVMDLIVFPVIVVIAVVASFRLRYSDVAPRIVWGGTPLINNIYWSKAMRRGGFCSETFMFNYTVQERCDDHMSGAINRRLLIWSLLSLYILQSR